MLRTLVLVVLARRHVRVAERRAPAGPDWPPPVGVVVAYQEAVGIAAAVRSPACGDHLEVAVLVVDDGSTDGTADVVRALGLPGVQQRTGDVVVRP